MAAKEFVASLIIAMMMMIENSNKYVTLLLDETTFSTNKHYTQMSNYLL